MGVYVCAALFICGLAVGFVLGLAVMFRRVHRRHQQSLDRLNASLDQLDTLAQPE